MDDRQDLDYKEATVTLNHSTGSETFDRFILVGIRTDPSTKKRLGSHLTGIACSPEELMLYMTDLNNDVKRTLLETTLKDLDDLLQKELNKRASDDHFQDLFDALTKRTIL